MPRLLLEPPDPHVPGRRRRALSTPALRLRRRGAAAAGSLLDVDPALVRIGAAAAATALAVASRGDVLVLALLLGLAAARVASGWATVAAAVAVLARWGSTSLGALAGAQAVLGPAGTVGPSTAAASSWLAAAAIVLAATPWSTAPIAGRGRRILVATLAAVPFGAAAADVAVGAGPGGSLALRVGVSFAGVIGAALLATARRRADRLVTILAIAAGVAAIPLAIVR